MKKTKKTTVMFVMEGDCCSLFVDERPSLGLSVWGCLDLESLDVIKTRFSPGYILRNKRILCSINPFINGHLHTYSSLTGLIQLRLKTLVLFHLTQTKPPMHQKCITRNKVRTFTPKRTVQKQEHNFHSKCTLLMRPLIMCKCNSVQSCAFLHQLCCRIVWGVSNKGVGA